MENEILLFAKLPLAQQFTAKIEFFKDENIVGGLHMCYAAIHQKEYGHFWDEIDIAVNMEKETLGQLTEKLEKAVCERILKIQQKHFDWFAKHRIYLDTVLDTLPK